MTIFVARNSNIVPSEKSGLYTVYHDMPSRIERAIKNHLIHVYSRKRYYEYHRQLRLVAGTPVQWLRRGVPVVIIKDINLQKSIINLLKRNKNHHNSSADVFALRAFVLMSCLCV